MNTITNLNTFPIGNSLDGVNIVTEEISTLSLLVDGTNSMLADLNMNNHSIKSMEAGVDSLDAVNKSQLDLKADTTYVNTQLALKSDLSYVNTQLALKADTTYVNTQLALKSDLSYVNTQLALKADTTYVNTQLALKSDTTYVNTQDNLRVLKTGDTMTGGLVINFSNASLDIKASAESQDSILYLSTPFNNGTTKKTAIIADGITSNSRADLHFCLNQTANNTTNVSVSDSKMIIKNSTGNVGIGTTTPSERLDVSGNGKIRGILTSNGLIVEGSALVDNLSINNNLTVGGTINANGLISRSAWSSGEIVQTKIQNQINGTGIAPINSNQTITWMTPSITTKNTNLSTITIVMKVDAPYYIGGSGGDVLELYVFDTTGGTENVIYKKTQAWIDGNGGGTRGSPIFPLILSHTPSQATSTLTRTYKISITNRTNEICYICRGLIFLISSYQLTDMDNYTIELTEIKK